AEHEVLLPGLRPRVASRTAGIAWSVALVRGGRRRVVRRLCCIQCILSPAAQRHLGAANSHVRGAVLVPVIGDDRSGGVLGGAVGGRVGKRRDYHQGSLICTLGPVRASARTCLGASTRSANADRGDTSRLTTASLSYVAGGATAERP